MDVCHLFQSRTRRVLLPRRFVRMDGGTGFIELDREFEEPAEEEFKMEECSAGIDFFHTTDNRYISNYSWKCFA